MTWEEFNSYIEENPDIAEKIDKHQQSGYEQYKEYIFKQYQVKVEPYLGLITQWKNEENPPNEEIIRITLDVSRPIWGILKKFPYIKAHLDLDKSIMKFKAQQNLEKAIKIGLEDRKPVAKFHEMQLQRYDDDYNKRKQGEGVANSLPTRIKIDIEDGSMSDVEIKKKSGTKYEG